MSLGGCSTFGKFGGKETSGRTLEEKIQRYQRTVDKLVPWKGEVTSLSNPVEAAGIHRWELAHEQDRDD